MADQDARIDLGIRGLGPAEHIGRGGFADVYRAEQLSLRRTVAVKVLRAQASDAETEARFERECHAIGAVSDHPHIVGVHEGGFTSNGRAYLVMEYLPGGSLSERIAESGPLPGEEAVDITIKIGRALGEAHRVGILHRDLKPANIMISAYGEPALGDFGIARIEGGHRTATGLVTASFAHAAPEVLEGHPPTVSADLYSLGSTMYELMVGRGPYYDKRDDTVWPLMKRILSEPMPTPQSAGMGPLLGQAFMRATARNPAVRYGSAESFVGDLLAAVAGPALTVTPSDPVPADVAAARSGPTARLGVGGSGAQVAPPGDARTAPDAGLTTPWAGPGSQQADPSTAPVSRLNLTAPPAAATPDLLLPGPDQPPTPAQDGPWTELYDRPPDTSVGSSPPVQAPAAAERSRAWSGTTLFGVTIAVLGGIGALVIAGLWLSSTLSADTPAVTASIEGVETGPVTAGEPLQIKLAGAPGDATFRPVIDGLATGSASSDLVPIAVDVGRHSIAVEVTTSGGDVTLTDPIEVYAIGDALTPGYRANLASVAVDSDAWPAALEIYDRLVGEGHDDVQILLSDNSPSQAPGYWNLFVPGFGDDPGAAESYCEAFGLDIPSECFAGFFDPGA